MRYLYPCRCGQKHSIQTHQAGQTLRCSCGAQLELPTLRKIVLLEKDTSDSIASKKSGFWSVPWGSKQRLLLLGIIALAVSCVSAGIAWSQWPTPPKRHVDLDALHRDVMALTPLQSMQAWQALTYTPLGKWAVSQVSPAETIFYQRRLGEQRSLAMVSAIAALIALAFFVGSLIVTGSPATSKKK